MHVDILDLREFYQTSLGRIVRHLLRQTMRRVWPSIKGEHVVGIGFSTPLFRDRLNEGGQLIALMPRQQGGEFWPREGPNITCLVDSHNLPLGDSSADKVVLVHALESEREPESLLSEVARILKGDGRLLLFVPNRRGLWAHHDHSPFGHGQPYSARQIRKELRDHGFVVDRVHRALFMPPWTAWGWGDGLVLGQWIMHVVTMLERIGARFFPGFAGILVVEARKQLYATLPAQGTAPAVRGKRPRLLLPISLPTPAGFQRRKS